MPRARWRRGPPPVVSTLHRGLPGNHSPAAPAPAPAPAASAHGFLPHAPQPQVLKILVNKQHGCGRFRDARREVGRLMDSIVADGRRATIAAAAVWLVGHLLGASIALNVGRDMATTKGCYLPALLFNPPQVSLAPSMLPQALRRLAKRVAYPASYAAKAALGTTVLRRQERDMEALFRALAPWVPELFVHERDINTSPARASSNVKIVQPVGGTHPDRTEGTVRLR